MLDCTNSLRLIAAGVLVGLFVLVAQPPARVSSRDTTMVKHLASTVGLPDVNGAVSLTSLATLSSSELAAIDIARLNLLTAEALPGAEALDVDQALSELDRWAEHTRFETDRHMYRFQSSPHEFENSEAYFRMLMLVVVLQADFSVQYNQDRIHEPDFTDAKDLFIHGLIGDDNGGTCVSMPALYVAVGRRLGYPLHLVVTKGHVFARWDDLSTGERFNIEGANRGLRTPADEYYEHWPHELTATERQNDWYLRSLTQSEVLAVFLMQRGHCLEDTGDLRGAMEAYALASQLAPKSPEAAHFVTESARLLHDDDLARDKQGAER